MARITICDIGKESELKVGLSHVKKLYMLPVAFPTFIHYTNMTTL